MCFRRNFLLLGSFVKRMKVSKTNIVVKVFMQLESMIAFQELKGFLKYTMSVKRLLERIRDLLPEHIPEYLNLSEIIMPV